MTYGGRYPENTDLNDIPQQWIDPETAQFAGVAQSLADSGTAIEDSDGDGVTDAGEFLADTDPLNPADHRSLGRTEDYDPNYSSFIDDDEATDSYVFADDDTVEDAAGEVVFLDPLADDGLDDIVA